MRLNLVKVIGSWCFVAVAFAASSTATGDLRLIRAVRSKDAEAVRGLLKQRVDVNARQGDGATALHWAAHLDNLAIADLLIRSGAGVDAANDLGATPLYLACTNRSAPMVERLLAAGANPNAKLLNGETALMTCARTGEANAVKALLVKGADVKAKELSHDQTALMWAAAHSHPDVVALLIEFGADIRTRARIYPQTVVGEETQRAGREELNYTVLRGGSTPLLFAARSGDAESAKLLLAAGADANDSLPDGTSALVLAAHSGHGKVGIALLEKGADPNAFGTGYSALHAAVLRSQLDLVKALVARKADPNVRTTKGTPIRRSTTDYNLPATLIGSTPYQLAAKFVESEIMRALVAGGADTKILMKDGSTPLMLAIGMGQGGRRGRRGMSGEKPEPESRVLAAVTAAVDLGDPVTAANQAGDTPLHGAAAQGFNTVVQFLADRGAQVNAKNKRGLTPLAALRTLGGGRGGRGGAGSAAAAAAAADANGDPLPPRETANASTVALLRKLGATE